MGLVDLDVPLLLDPPSSQVLFALFRTPPSMGPGQPVSEVVVVTVALLSAVSVVIRVTALFAEVTEEEMKVEERRVEADGLGPRPPETNGKPVKEDDMAEQVASPFVGELSTQRAPVGRSPRKALQLSSPSVRLQCKMRSVRPLPASGAQYDTLP